MKFQINNKNQKKRERKIKRCHFCVENAQNCGVEEKPEFIINIKINPKYVSRHSTKLGITFLFDFCLHLGLSRYRSSISSLSGWRRMVTENLTQGNLHLRFQHFRCRSESTPYTFEELSQVLTQ